MNSRELEVALARLADKFTEAKAPSTAAVVRFKGETFKIYFDLRVGGKKEPSTMLRMKARALAGGYIGSGIGDVLVAQIEAFEFGSNASTSAEPSHSDPPYSETIFRLAP